MPLLCLIFLLSGVAALVFEQLWFRQTGLLFGNTVLAASCVLTAFMSGLSLGGLIAAKYGQRWSSSRFSSLRAFAIAEVFVAISGLLLVWYLPDLALVLAPVLGALELPLLKLALTYALAFLLLLIPATAMGLGLPLVVAAVGAGHRYSARLGALYGWNTFGAMLGVLGTEFWLIPSLGIRQSGLLAALLEGLVVLAVLLLAFWLGRQANAISKSDQHTSPDEVQSANSVKGNSANILLIAAALSGFALLALEVIWFRLLLQTHRGTALAFAVMLALVLFGIALGGVLAGRYSRGQDSIGQGPLSPVGLAITGGLTTLLGYWGLKPFWFSGWLSGSDELLQLLLVGSCLILPTALVSGAFFTALGDRLRLLGASDTAATGRLVAANTLGAAIGALAGGLLLLPLLGSWHSILLLTGLWLFVALLLLSANSEKSLRAALLGNLPAVVILTVVILSLGFNATSNSAKLHDVASRYYRDNDQAETIKVVEGQTETVQLLRRDFLGEALSYRLVTNSYSMSGTADDSQRYMKLFAWLPMVMGQPATDSLLISYGVGSTASALVASKDVQTLQIVDPSTAILGMSTTIHGDRNPLDSEKVSVAVEDGRHFLQTTDRQFDLITGEPPPPRLAGIVSLYTQEYFQLLHSRLKPGGRASYWLPVDQLTEASTRAILAAFCEAFADCSLWGGSHYNWILLGSRDGKSDSSSTESRLQQMFSDAGIVADLAARGIEHPGQLAATFIADHETLEEWIAGQAPLVDDHPYRLSIEQPSQSTLRRYAAWMNAEASRQRFNRSAQMQTLWPESLAAAIDEAWLWQAALNGQISRDPQRRLAVVDQLLRHSSLRTPVLWLLDSSVTQQQVLRKLTQFSNDPGFRYQLAIGALANRQYAVADQVLGELVQDDARLLDVFILAGCRAHREPSEDCASFAPELPDMQGFEHPPIN